MEAAEQPPELLKQFSRGDLDAFESLFRQFQGEVYRWIARIVRDPALSEDLTIETFWRIYRAHARFDPRRSFGAWARRIATNVALDCLKSRRIRSRQLESALPENLPGREAADPALQRQLRESVERAFQRLPVKLQIVAMLALVEKQSHKEIAEALGISTAAVKVRVFRAVRRLRSDLEKWGLKP